MDSAEIASIKNNFTEFPRCFTQQDIFEYTNSNKELTSLAQESITNDSEFISIHSVSNGDIYHISNITLVKWYIGLNRRLVESKYFKMSENELRFLLCELRKEGIWVNTPKEYIEFGIRYSLLKECLENAYVFPLAYILSFLSPNNSNVAIDYITKYYTSTSDRELDNKLVPGIKNVLATLTEREESILCRRLGLLGQKQMTLEMIGNKLGVTRERIRQIEKKCWRKIFHPSRRRRLFYLFLTNLLLSNFDLIIRETDNLNEIMFLARCMNIPLLNFPYTDLQVIGLDEKTNTHRSGIRKSPNPITIEAYLYGNYGIPLARQQLEEISQTILSETHVHIRKVDRVYEILRRIGKPAHFSIITDLYNETYPDDFSREHVIQATLLRDTKRIAWIGIKGTYALKEWGFERPSDTLFNTIAEIVREQHSKNGKPVAMNTIQAELGKYRKIVNRNSVVLASYYNEQITNVYKDYFIPIEFSEKISAANGDTDSELLDRVLRQFETQANK